MENQQQQQNNTSESTPTTSENANQTVSTENVDISVKSPMQVDESSESKTQENLITLTVKTPKDKETVLVRPDATIKEVFLLKIRITR